jgi:Mg2+ and Co2+ transporter CorA
MHIETNYLRVLSFHDEHGCALIGSLNYSADPNDTDAYQLLHYYVTEKNLVTIDFDISTISKITRQAFMARLEICGNAFEAFLFIIGEILNTFLDGIDDFEEKLIELEKTVRFHNRANILEEIFERRSEMLLLKQLTIPIEEILLAMEEAFHEHVKQMEEFRKTSVRLERTMRLLDHYDSQIETLLNINMTLYSYRGNEIIKALTVFTVLVTPVTVLGALWGMNFQDIPEFKWEYGYEFAWTVILLSTGSIFWWLRRKGWMGDVLRGRKKK